MVLRKKIRVRLPLVLTILIVCSLCSCATLRPVVLHPIEKTDIFRVEKGASIKNPSLRDTAIVEKDGWFLSDLYLEEVMKAKVEK